MGVWNFLGRLGLSGSAPPSFDARIEQFWKGVNVATYQTKLADLAGVGALLATEGEERARLLVQCARLFEREDSYWTRNLIGELFKELADPKFPYSAETLTEVVSYGTTPQDGPPLATLLAMLEHGYGQREMPAALAAACRELQGRLRPYATSGEIRKIQNRLERLLLPLEERESFRLTRADAWTNELCDILDALEPGDRDRLVAVLALVEHPSGSKPSDRWLKAAQSAIAAFGAERFAATMVRVLERVGVNGGVPVMMPGWFQEEWREVDPTLLSPKHSDLLKGLVWALAPQADAAAVQAIGDAAERCFKKVPGVGPRAPKIGNACLQALAVARAPNAVAQLSRLKVRVKHNSSRTQVARALTQVAGRTGVSEDALEDMSVPTCGLTSVGRLERTIGDATALVELESSRDFELTWRMPSGKLQKSIPAAVKTEHPDELKQLKANLKELEQQLPGQARRLETLLLSQRALPLDEFRERFLAHPLVGFLARRLLWRLPDSRVVALRDDRFVDVDDHTVEPEPGAALTLWHPLHATVDEIRAWRAWLEAHDVTQPFKQAHREVYILTDAERQTGTYSNRFAAHVLRQHQFAALCRERGWQYKLQGGFDSHNTPHIELPAHGLRVEYWVDGGPQDDGGMSDAGIYVHVVTDQVRFVRLGETEPLALEQVPPLVFSELMRDVDLFVGVTSLGNDPNWQDNAGAAQHGVYWHSFAFGELGETAKTRREALTRLLPRLKIARACSLEDRFLVVRGRLRTYRIHLGSANIQMDPNSQYLCIVPGRTISRPGNLMLPFEGDSLLSIIISKAILLADDHKITDPSIRSQIGTNRFQN